MYLKSFVAISRYTFLEAIRDRLFVLLLVGLLCSFGLVQFVGELSITEGREIRLALIATGQRLFAVFIIGLFVATSMVREFNEKGCALVLSLSLPRPIYYLGKLAGFSLISLVLVALIGLELAIFSEPWPLLIWLISLFCELLIIVAFSLLCLFTFSSTTIVFSIVLMFYVLARNIEVIRLIADSPIINTEGFLHVAMGYIIDGIAYLLPNLHLFTKTTWLVYEDVSYLQLFPILTQTLIYVILLSAATSFDLYRKEL